MDYLPTTTKSLLQNIQAGKSYFMYTFPDSTKVKFNNFHYDKRHSS